MYVLDVAKVEATASYSIVIGKYLVDFEQPVFF